jgi:hypothetical protein
VVVRDCGYGGEGCAGPEGDADGSEEQSRVLEGRPRRQWCWRGWWRGLARRSRRGSLRGVWDNGEHECGAAGGYGARIPSERKVLEAIPTFSGMSSLS